MLYTTHSIQDLIGPINEFEEKNAPREMYAQGDASILINRTRVSVVGARKCSKQGAARAAKLAKMLVEREVVIVSGLALGIDAAAHWSAINNKGDTVAVIGTPIDKSYPKENAELQRKIAKEHLLLSQFPVGERTYRSSFPQRNRTMALISDATVIVEASNSSGSLSQGWEAIRLGRPLWIMQSVFDSQEGGWGEEMVSYGARVLSDTNFDDLIKTLPIRSAALEELDDLLNV